ncbi:unnamed protein product [Sphenostylis stenocarpa]|uniref:Uncharacterized protein n=1 Tax=Sphenostylis stenocarpa TaxID=92480 RepID=A0AA86VHJ8_9FABA|nr:unnamed protein product [Sphenostylis stenocarpa]
MARLVSLSGLELEGARIALLSQFSYSQLSSAATKSVLLGFDLRLGIYLSYAHAKGKGSPKRGRRMNSSAVVKGKEKNEEMRLIRDKSQGRSEQQILIRRFDIGLLTDVESEAKTALLPFLIHPLPQLQAITLFRALASNPDIRSIDICRAGKKAVWSRNPVTEGFR